MDGEFFYRSDSLKVRPPLSLFPACDRCKLFESCITQKMKPYGRGEKKILIVGDYGGEEEDREGRPFVGPTGSYLRGVLYDLGIDMNRDCVATNATICYSPTIKKHKTAIDDCRPNLVRAIKETKPEVILLLGMDAVESAMGYLWRGDIGTAIGRWVGWHIPVQVNNTWVCPTWNPAFIQRERKKNSPNRALEFHFKRHIKGAVELRGRPWPNGIPDYKRQVEVLFNPQEAAGRIARYTSGMIAFDYETTTLKPDGPYAEIVCASVCWNGKETIAFHWCRETREAMKVLLENPEVGKIGANDGFEHNWSAVQAGIGVKGWAWDTVNNAHIIDCRQGGICSVKFNAWIKLGLDDYSAHVAQFLESKSPGGNSPNRIREIKPYDLLEYCGIDSLVEWELAKKQADELGVEL